jgi:hypothetical protein
MKSMLVICTSLPLMAGSAFAQLSGSPVDTQSRAPATVSPVESHSPGAMFSLDRGNGRGKINIKCAESDGTRDCVQAVLPVLSSGQGSGGVIFATTSLKCGNTIIQVSTGTSGGNCAVAGPENGPRNSAGCNDGNNTASASCDTGCGATSGSGSCTMSLGK